MEVFITGNSLGTAWGKTSGIRKELRNNETGVTQKQEQIEKSKTVKKPVLHPADGVFKRA
jgi:hypothetical protein